MNIEIPDGPFRASCHWDLDSNNSWLVRIKAWDEVIFEVNIPGETSGPGLALIKGQQIFAQRLRKLLEST
jgi:hypothetical protein